MEDIAVWLIVGAALAWAGRRFFRKRATPGCASGCAGCGAPGTKLVPLSRRRS